jgi:hypothetical protein
MLFRIMPWPCMMAKNGLTLAVLAAQPGHG